MLLPRQNKKGFAQIFLVIIISLVIVFILGVFVYMVTTVNSELKTQFIKLDAKNTTAVNATKTLEDTLGSYGNDITSLYWIAGLLILGLIFGMFISAYLVTINRIWFVFYVLIMIIATIVAAEVSNAYEVILTDATLGATFGNFVGANFVLQNLVLWVVFIGFIGGIIMFVNMQRRTGYG